MFLSFLVNEILIIKILWWVLTYTSTQLYNYIGGALVCVFHWFTYTVPKIFIFCIELPNLPYLFKGMYKNLNFHLFHFHNHSCMESWICCHQKSWICSKLCDFNSEKMQLDVGSEPTLWFAHVTCIFLGRTN